MGEKYDELAQTDDIQRTKVIAELTLIQQFMLGLRDVERIMKLPYENSIVYNWHSRQNEHYFFHPDAEHIEPQKKKYYCDIRKKYCKTIYDLR